MRFRVILILLFLSNGVYAQTPTENFVKDLIESMAESLPEDFDISDWQDRLIYYQTHPININNTTTEALHGLLFLSPLQISNLFYHLKTNGKLIDVLELQSIPEFDKITIERLLPFITLKQSELVDKITFNNIKRFGTSDLLIRFGQVIEQAKGYTDLPNSSYLGSPARTLMRYKFNYSNRISAALILEKDAGEKFIRHNGANIFDYQSAHLAISNTGKFKKIIIGDYAMQFGQGLTLWTGFAFGKAPEVTSVAKKDIGLKPYTSTNETSFFRGLAGTINLFKNIEFSPFISYRKLDASLVKNENNEETLATLNETGLHRTPSEIENRNSTEQKIYGGVLKYQTNTLTIGAIGYQTNFNKSFVVAAPYTFYNFTGKSLTNIGLHYTYTFKNFYFFGEMASSLNHTLATINGVLISLSPKVATVFLHRHYPANYHNFYNQATAEASNAANEKGFYTGLNVAFTKAWALSFYADYFKFPWLKYRVDAPSQGYELLGQVNYSPSKTLKAFLRYKYELKEQNTDLATPINFLEDVIKQSYRADISFKVNTSLTFQHRFEVSQFKKGGAKSEFGFMVYQDIAYAKKLSTLTANIRLAYFNTPTYNSRIYAYEDDVLYNFNFGIYNGKGFRTYINLKYKVMKKLDLWGRYALYYYPKINSIGSGLEQINGNKKTDVKLQLRYQF